MLVAVTMLAPQKTQYSYMISKKLPDIIDLSNFKIDNAVAN